MARMFFMMFFIITWRKNIPRATTPVFLQNWLIQARAGLLKGWKAYRSMPGN